MNESIPSLRSDDWTESAPRHELVKEIMRLKVENTQLQHMCSGAGK